MSRPVSLPPKRSILQRAGGVWTLVRKSWGFVQKKKKKKLRRGKPRRQSGAWGQLWRQITPGGGQKVTGNLGRGCRWRHPKSFDVDTVVVILTLTRVGAKCHSCRVSPGRTDSGSAAAVTSTNSFCTTGCVLTQRGRHGHQRQSLENTHQSLTRKTLRRQCLKEEHGHLHCRASSRDLIACVIYMAFFMLHFINSTFI